MNTQLQIINPKNLSEWRDWLEKNYVSEEAVWLVFYTKDSGKKIISWSEAVDVALCFGWIDSKKIKIDEVTSHQYFSKRKARSTWSRINKEKVEQLIKEGLMTEAGLKSIEIAKQNGSWTILDSVEDLEIPADLEAAFKENPDAKNFYSGLSKSVKKMLLYWLVSARRPETRHKRISELIECASEGRKPKHLQ